MSSCETGVLDENTGAPPRGPCQSMFHGKIGDLFEGHLDQLLDQLVSPPPCSVLLSPLLTLGFQPPLIEWPLPKNHCFTNVFYTTTPGRSPCLKSLERPVPRASLQRTSLHLSIQDLSLIKRTIVYGVMLKIEPNQTPFL